MNKNKQLNKYKISIYFLVVLELSIYFFTYEFRSIISNNNIFEINFLFLISYILFIIMSKNIKKLNKFILFNIVLLILLIIINSMFLNISMINIIKMISIIILPLSIISIDINKECFDIYFEKFVKVFNVIFIIIVSLGILDYITNGSLQRILLHTNYIFNKYIIMVTLKNSIYRFFCFLGHPLTIAKYSILFFIINNIYSKYYKRELLNKYLVIILTLLGVILSASKTGMILSLIMILCFTNIRKKRVFFYGIVIILFIIIVNSNFFINTVAARFVEGYQNGDISSGRNMLIRELINSNYNFKFFSAPGMGYSGIIARNFLTGISNFEYPAIMFLIDYGIIGTIIIYIIIFIYPIIVFIKNRDYYILINFIIYSVMCNSYNSISVAGDGMLQLTFLIFIAINVSKSNNIKKEKL